MHLSIHCQATIGSEWSSQKKVERGTNVSWAKMLHRYTYCFHRNSPVTGSIRRLEWKMRLMIRPPMSFLMRRCQCLFLTIPDIQIFVDCHPPFPSVGSSVFLSFGEPRPSPPTVLQGFGCIQQNRRIPADSSSPWASFHRCVHPNRTSWALPIIPCFSISKLLVIGQHRHQQLQQLLCHLRVATPLRHLRHDGELRRGGHVNALALGPLQP